MVNWRSKKRTAAEIVVQLGHLNGPVSHTKCRTEHSLAAWRYVIEEMQKAPGLAKTHSRFATPSHSLVSCRSEQLTGDGPFLTKQ
jgi:hypothetical protein